MIRTRANKRSRSENKGRGMRDMSGVGTLVASGVGGIRAALTEPQLVMQLSTVASATGSLCLILAVFSGPVLVFLAIIALGVCGMLYSVRQRGALEFLPRGVVDLLTRTTLLDFLTDTRAFDAVKPYLVFMMGLSSDETQGVLRSLPEGVRETLTRPGLLHTLPGQLQGLLLPLNRRTPAALLDNASSSSGGDRSRQRRRTRVEYLESVEDAGSRGRGRGRGSPRPAEGGAGSEHDEDPGERERPLGQLVWNPLPLPALEGTPLEAPLPGERPLQDAPPPGTGRVANGERHRLREEQDGILEDGEREDGSPSPALSTRRRRVGSSGPNGGRSGRLNSGTRDDNSDGSANASAGVAPWDDYEPRLRSRSVSPTAARRDRARNHRRRRRQRASTDEESTDEDPTDEGSADEGSAYEGSIDEGPADEGSADEGSTGDGPTDEEQSNTGSSRSRGVQYPRRFASVLPDWVGRQRDGGGGGGGMDAGGGGGGARPSPSMGGLMPSAERIVGSIVQSRMDNAVRAAWNAVDERSARRVAVGSGIALAAHVAFSERARRQAGSMLSGGILAALAGTATVCASLAYLKPTESFSTLTEDVAVDNQPSAAARAGGSEERRGGSVGAPNRSRRRPEEEGSRLTKYGAGLRRVVAMVTPSTRNMVRLLGMICVLLAVRKWQMFRRAAMKATMPRAMYGTPSP